MPASEPVAPGPPPGRRSGRNPSTGDTRSRLLAAATRQFAEKGFDGARTQAIADEAGVNKAMLYYHFQDKEHLYREMLTGHFQIIVGQVFPALMQPDQDARDRILTIVAAYLGFLREHPHVRALMLHEFAAGGERLKTVAMAMFESIPGFDAERVLARIGSMMAAGEIRQGDPRQLFLHILSLTIFPFAARPLLETIWRLEPEEYDELIAERVGAITDLFDNGLFIGKEAS
jgi:AcrR family transcriptional regulator